MAMLFENASSRDFFYNQEFSTWDTDLLQYIAADICELTDKQVPAGITQAVSKPSTRWQRFLSEGLQTRSVRAFQICFYQLCLYVF